jgi:hypothetical protein
MLKVIAAFGHPKLTSSAERPIHLMLATVMALCFLFGCETSNYVPPVTPAMTSASSRKQHIDAVKLERGRSLFVHRCIECHTLPAMWKYSREDWPKIVNDMSHRASLKPAERDAIVAYILACERRNGEFQ